MRRLELTLPSTWPREDIGKLADEIDDVLTHWALQLQDSAQRISGDEVLVHDVDGVETTLEDYGVTYSQHDEMDGVADSTAHTLFLLLDGTRAMTGDLDMNLHDVYLGSALAGANGALTGYASSGGGAPAIHKVEWMPHYQAVYGHGWHIEDQDEANAGGYMTVNAVGGVGRIYLGPTVHISDLFAGSLDTDTINERTATAGVTIDSCLIKDGAAANALLLDGASEAAFAKLADNELITGNWAFVNNAILYFDDGAAAGTEKIYSPADTILRFETAAYATVGTGTPTHIAGTANSFHVTGKSEFDSWVWFDSYILQQHANNSTFFWYEGATPAAHIEMRYDTDQFLWGLGSEVGRQLILCERDIGRDHDYDHPVQTNPTIYGQDARDPDISNNAWWSITHDATGMLISTGPNVGAGSSPATIDNYISFAPRGTESFRLTGGGDALIPNSGKHYFDAGAAAGTEYITSGADGYLDAHFEDADKGMRFYSGANLMFGIRRYSVSLPSYLRLDVPARWVSIFHNGAEKLRGDGASGLNLYYLTLSLQGGWDGVISLYPTQRMTCELRGASLTAQCLLGVSSAYGGRQFILTDYANITKDHDHTLQTNPTFYVHSPTDPNTANDEWISFFHNVTNGVIALGSGQLLIGPTANQEAAAAKWHTTVAGTEYAGSAGAGYYDIYGLTAVRVNPILILVGGLRMNDEQNITFNTTTGSKIGTATNQKIGFWNAAPVVQPSHIVDADGTLADLTTKFNTLLAQAAATGMQAAA